MNSSGEDTHAEQAQPSTTRAANTSEDDGEWSDEAIVSSLRPEASTLDQGAQAVPRRPRHLSRRDKLLRGSAVVLAVALVLAAVIWGTLRSGSSSASHDSSSDSGQVTTLAAHPAVQLSAGPWEQIALPHSPAVSWSFAPVPSDPSTIFALPPAAQRMQMARRKQGLSSAGARKMRALTGASSSSLSRRRLRVFV